jgi:predicted nucleic acid-binding Zn ribbon protein
MAQVTNKLLKDLLPRALIRMQSAHNARIDLLRMGWAEALGERYAPMTRVVSFIYGTLTIHVNNSMLYSLLERHEKERLLQHLQKQFPGNKIQSLRFRMGE